MDASPTLCQLLSDASRYSMSTKFHPEVCEHCTQTKQVIYGLDPGTADIVKAVAVRIRIKGQNSVHLTREMGVSNKEFNRRRMLEEGVMTYSMRNNVIRAHKHGLLAKIRGDAGFWCLTRKGAAFLKGERVARYAVQNKITKHIDGYWRPEEETVTIQELQRSGETYWGGIDFDIVEGRTEIFLRSSGQSQLFHTLPTTAAATPGGEKGTLPS